MRILHVYEIANVARILADAQTGMGHPAKVMARPNPVLEPPDILLPLTTNPVASQLAILRHAREIREADILHIHGGIWRSHLIWTYLRERFPAKVVVVHLHGSETRTGRGLHHLQVADRILASTPDLLRIVPTAAWQPAPVVLPAEALLPTDGKPILGHFPSDRAIKGTDAIMAAFQQQGPAKVSTPEAGVTRLDREDSSLLIVERVPHARALEIMERCHVVVDQVNALGIYSLVSVEAMARGRVVVSSYDPSLYPEPLPIVQATPDSLNGTLNALLRDRPSWRGRGQAGRDYAARVHGAEAAARQTIAMYEDALRHRRG